MDADHDSITPLDRAADFGRAPAPDVRGWLVIGSDGSRIGRVDQVVEDPDDHEPRYLDVGLDSELRDHLPGYAHLLVPVRDTRVDARAGRVVVEGASRAEIGSIALSVERRVADHPYDGPERRARLAAPAPLVERERAIVDRDEPRDPRG